MGFIFFLKTKHGRSSETWLELIVSAAFVWSDEVASWSRSTPLPITLGRMLIPGVEVRTFDERGPCR